MFKHRTVRYHRPAIYFNHEKIRVKNLAFLSSERDSPANPIFLVIDTQEDNIGTSNQSKSILNFGFLFAEIFVFESRHLAVNDYGESMCKPKAILLLIIQVYPVRKYYTSIDEFLRDYLFRKKRSL